jgi:hypothetical protein
MDKFVIRKNTKPKVSSPIINDNTEEDKQKGVDAFRSMFKSKNTKKKTSIEKEDDSSADVNLSKEEIQELLKTRGKYKKLLESANKANKKYAATEKGKEARRKAMRAFRQREKEKKNLK